MSRIVRIVGVGYPHHIVQRGNNRQPVFFDDWDKIFYLKLLEKYSFECECDVHSYCLMSNHIHLLISPQKQAALAKFMQKLSLCFTQHINRKYQRTGRLWECRYYSSLINKEGYLWTVLRYIERNPIRANIVSRPEDYPWSSAARHLGFGNGNKNFLKIVWKDDHERNEYVQFLNNQEDEEIIKLIRNVTQKGIPF